MGSNVTMMMMMMMILRQKDAYNMRKSKVLVELRYFDIYVTRGRQTYHSNQQALLDVHTPSEPAK